ncbi:unknown similar to AMEV159 [Mythimna separata entomopoxvirus 'L']|uniref:Uncharacterized protein n=1 Tax=Mythimna separata entomopoxvirus 'L' TaxID=1293572 RepID=A0A916NYI8_9POXV|nr:unknown similar to AMEV159 [Mythimna separata entomopoxvirus 'L']CCU56393.1 unknown similar to AMEV159 [Mythimna separata entomopoxvirus 'L']
MNLYQSTSLCLLLSLTVIKCEHINIRLYNKNISSLCNDSNAINILTCIDINNYKCLKKYNSSTIIEYNVKNKSDIIIHRNINYIKKYPIFCYNNTIYYINNSFIYNINNNSIKLYYLQKNILFTNNIKYINYNSYYFDIKYISGVSIRYYYIIPFIEYLLQYNIFENIKLKYVIKKYIYYTNNKIYLFDSNTQMINKGLKLLFILLSPLLLYFGFLIILYFF